MARKTKNRSNRQSEPADTGQAIRDSAQKIWLAGLGAFERARTEGPRMFETLVEQGRNMGARAVGAADEALKSVRELSETVRQMAAANEGRRARGTARAGTRGKAKAKAKAAAPRTRKAPAAKGARRTAAKGTRARRKRPAAS